MSSRKSAAADVVIVGAGASGATAAKVLAEAGLRVVGLDRGPWLRPEDHFSGDELKFVGRGYLGPDPELNPRTIRESEDASSTIGAYNATPYVVGGGTVHWGGWLPRPMPSDFIQRSLHGEVEGANLADWPFTYDDIEPYLSKIEWELGVCGLARANKYEPPRSRDYPLPPLPPTAFGVRFYDACAKLGINAYPLPHAVVSGPYNGRDCTNFTGFWGQFGDPTDTRSTTLTTFTPAAVATGNYDLRPNCYVREVTLHPNGRARGVVYLDENGQEAEQVADVVILCLGAIETTRLLFLSSSNRFPDGLANSSGQVGRNATFHEALLTLGLFEKTDVPLFGSSGHDISGGTLEFYETDERRGFINGCLVAATQVGQPIHWRFPDRPRWGLAAKNADRDYYNHAMALQLLLHDLPVESNRIDLDPFVRDAWGLPVARVTHRPHPNDVEMARWQTDKNIEILQAAGAVTTLSTELEPGVSTTFHQHGTARMGTNPATSVLNEWGEAHDVKNLYILDGSCFPTSMGVNPTLTIMANAWRCAERILRHDETVV